MEKDQKKLILFMPSMDGGGVEKNLIIVANFLSKYLKNLILITFDDKFNKKFSKKIKIINFKRKTNKNFTKYFKYFVCLLILSKQVLKDRRTGVISFQANIYTIILSIILRFNLIIRSNASPSGWTKSFIKNYLFKIFFRYPKSIIVNSLDFKKEIDKKFGIKSNLIYNPLNKKEILIKSKEKINLKLFKNKKSLKLINISRFTDQKDHLTLLKAFNKIHKKIEVELLIVGYGVNKNKIHNFISKNKLRDKIKVLGFQQNPYKFINKSDVFILTSRFEGLPNVLLESLTLKKFIISSNCPTGPREILANGKFGFLFKIQSYKKLSELILKYANNKDKYKNKIYLGFKSLDRFNLDVNGKKYLNEVLKII
jgi:glycosyltransferase involved in cell wall biosynthesis